MKSYKPTELVFMIEQDFDFGHKIMITPKIYWNERGCFVDQHFTIEGLEHWGCGDTEATWLVSRSRHRKRIARKLRKLGMTEVKWGERPV